MPTVTVHNPAGEDQTFTCDSGANLREVLLQQGVKLYNDQATLINCHGLGTCGTCAVKVAGAVSPANWRDRARRSLPPHSPDRDLRLACQTQVLGNVTVTKFSGFWGQGQETVAIAHETPLE
ncbi:MAG: 2Fe-2S iron-sulfur cluster-binding protein [Elainellaceae cyanobacterium]